MTGLFSFGHSTRSADEIVAILGAHGIEHVADVRAHPGSRRHPHVASAAMRGWLAKAGIDYVHRRAPWVTNLPTGGKNVTHAGAGGLDPFPRRLKPRPPTASRAN